MAAQEEVKIRVSWIDDATSKVNAFGDNINDFGAKIDKTLRGAEDASKKFALALAGIGAGLIAIGVTSVNAARDQIAADKQLEAVLKSTKGAAGLAADEIKNMADELSHVTNFTDDAIQQGQNMLLTFTKIGKDVFPEATETMLNMSAAMGTDLKGSAIQLGKALNDPIQGISALSRVGVSFTDEQKSVIESLVKTGDVAGAQKIILNELATEFGGVAKAVADPITILKNEIGNMAEAIGFKLMPYVTQVTDAFFSWLDSMGGADAVVDKLFASLVALEPYLPIIAGAIVGGLVPALYVSAAAIWANVTALTPFIAAGALIAGAAYLIYTAWTENWFGVQETFGPIAETLTGTIIGINNTLKDHGGVVGTVKEAWQITTTEWGSLLELIHFQVMNTFNNIQVAIETVWMNVKNTWIETWDAIGAFFQQKLDSILGFFKSWYDTVLGWINAVLSRLGLAQQGVADATAPKRPGANPTSSRRAFGGVVEGIRGLDQIPTMLTAGEIVLNSAQQKNVASAISSAPSGGGLTVVVSGNSFYGDDESFAERIGESIIKNVIPHLTFSPT